VSERKRTF